ncbi:MAG: phosphoribosylamine--glycine ligase [Sedimentisphaerales bacterium]|nr:phosphoribosylamine--glycine ligase [Sedimentisphaerales bacterium]
MKVLLIGNGGREDAIAWKLAQSGELKKLYIAPGNPGTARWGENVDIKAEDVGELVKFAKEKKIDLAIIGPEDPLAAGAADAFESVGIKAFGPNQAAAQLEADKAFAKQIMKSSSVSTAEGRTFTKFADAKAYIASRDEPVVIKAAGLAKGKGVMVCDEPSDGILAAEKMMVNRIFGSAGDKIVVEDKLIGEEASILAFVDGRSIYVMESSQDHKPVGDGDTGPNTGGMGAYSPAPVITDAMMSQIEREILVPVVDCMNRNDTPYKGVLYAGIMVTAGGPRVLEFNVRFGDPETQPIMMRLKSDLLEVCLAVCEHKLDEITLQWDKRPAICVVMVSGGYPGDYQKGKEITGIDKAGELKDVVVFHAGTAMKDGKLVTAGGRVLGITAAGDTVADAKARVYEGVGRISFDGAHYRHDIADKAIRRR